MKPKEIRDMSDDQIQQELQALERRVFDLRTQAETEELQVPSELRNAPGHRPDADGAAAAGPRGPVAVGRRG